MGLADLVPPQDKEGSAADLTTEHTDDTEVDSPRRQGEHGDADAEIGARERRVFGVGFRFLLVVRGFMSHFVIAFPFGASAGVRMIGGTKSDGTAEGAEHAEARSRSTMKKTEFL